jgi:hypothetical protein
MLKRNGVLILTAVLICCVFLSLLPMSAAAQTEQEIIQGEESFEVVVALFCVFILDNVIGWFF